MAVCQYFLQGRCRFGQNCRNEHSYNTDDRSNRSTSSTHHLSDIVKQIANEVVLAEKGGQWPLSCFAPVKEGINFPGWEDISPEEVRWKMYEARGNGTLNECINEVSQLYSNAEKRRNALKQPTNERINLIINVLKGEKEHQSKSNTFPTSSDLNKSKFHFGSSSTNIFGSFGQSKTNQGIFGAATQSLGNQGSIFGGSKPLTGIQGSIFGGPAQSSNASPNVFGGNSSSFSNQNIFGRPNSTNTTTSSGFFSNMQSTNQNVFSKSASSNSNIFSSTSASTPNIFSSPQNLVSVQSSINAFSTNSGTFPLSSSSSLFNSNNTFPQSNESKSQNIFGRTQDVSIFQNQNSLPRVSSTLNSQNTSPNIFRNPDQTLTNISLNNELTSTDLSVYSKAESLSEEELKAFAAATFTFGRIPLKPPPQSYCK